MPCETPSPGCSPRVLLHHAQMTFMGLSLTEFAARDLNPDFPPQGGVLTGHGG